MLFDGISDHLTTHYNF